MTKKQCEQIADLRYTWPGKDEAMACIEHASGINNVASSIGLHLQMIPLEAKDIGKKLQCSSFVKG